MKLIAHRGNIDGPNPERENSPEYIEEALKAGYDVEVDVWYDCAAETFWLGHDEPQYEATRYWMSSKKDKLWVHCKSLASLEYFNSKTGGFNYFWHQNDDYTLTSRRQIWAYPGKPYTKDTVIVMPEWKKDVDWDMLRVTNCLGICSDYVGKLK
jgi:hypothetical protein